MDYLDNQYDALVNYVKDVEKKFISRYLPPKPEDGPDIYGLDVRSYCVLVHAALEEFFEKIAIYVMDESVAYFLKGIWKKPLLAMVSHARERLKVEPMDNVNEQTAFDCIRNILANFKTQFSNEIHANHGTSIDCLRKLLMPVYINIPDDVNWRNSLGQLTKDRGSMAHKQVVDRIPSPEDVHKYVKDSLEMARNVRDQAKSLLS